VRRALGLERDYLLYVGSLKPNKNLTRVLAAWEQTGLAARGLELAVVGARGPVFGDYRLESVPEGVRLLGYVDDGPLPALYSGAQAFVFPSLYEGFGIPVVEAMACGTPVVSSTTTSLAEVCGDAALLVDPQQTEAIAAAMLRLVDDDTLRQSLRARGLERARCFTWERATQLTWQVLERAQAEAG
jgi:glycosyltransferase involved in cell wall biosynthesis